MKFKLTCLITSVAAFFFSAPAFSQNCNLALNDKVKMTSTQISYSNVVPYNPKWAKAKEAKKDEMIAAYNDDVRSGKIAGYSNLKGIATFKKSTVNGTDEYTISANLAGTNFLYYLSCKNDTIYTCLNRTPVMLGDASNPAGYRIEGPMVLPMNMKVGDSVPSYDDITIGFPASTDITVKKKTFLYSTEKETSAGWSGSIVTTTSVYKTIDVDVRKTLSYSGHIIHHVHAMVTGEEEIIISGIKYKALVIESEGWSKSTVTTDYETADSQVKKELYSGDKKVQRYMNKMAVRKGWTNNLGYTVGIMKEWFVPQIGIVKFEAYDIYGGIMMINTTTGLE